KQARAALAEVRQFRAKLREKKDDAAAELERKAAALEGAERRRGERPLDGPREPTFARVAGDMEQLLSVLQAADVAPTSQVVAACEEAQKSLRTLIERWHQLREKKAD